MPDARRVQAAILALVIALGIGAGALGLAASRSASTQQAPFHGSAMPELFPAARLAAVRAPLRAAERRAHRLAAAWLGAHPGASEATFADWAVRAMGAPPGAAATRREIGELKALGTRRDAVGIRAARWLESHGKKQPWKLFRKQAKPFVGSARAKRAKATLKAALALAGSLQARAKARYARPSPYVADPSVHALNQAKFAGKLRYSYPSKHTVLAGAAVAVLAPLEPHRRAELEWMAEEIAYSRLYAGGHYRSDLEAGMFLGTLVGEFERRRASLAS